MHGFTKLTPDYFLGPLEKALDTELTGVVLPLHSYINRVYEVRSPDGTSYIVKYYRPGRWTTDALRDEQEFLSDCDEIDIPVVSPLKLKNGETLGLLDDIHFAVFPKRGGRQFDIESDESWHRVGMLLGRLHNAGQKRKAASRLSLTLADTTEHYIRQLLAEHIPAKQQQGFSGICGQIILAIKPYFAGVETIRIHGDFHSGNILHRPDEGLMVIDFDDMMNGPPVQDFWLLLPDYYPASKKNLEKLLEGYKQFRDVDPRSLLLIEGLRAMRMIYFLAWCGMQREDVQFRNNFPDWGSERFWNQEIQYLREQYAHIIDSLAF
jgi:Ser/Thr protein kinase RdoA (MazF antagonist)